MSRCTRCGNELLTGDIHYEIGLCNKCYKEIMDNIRNARPIVININDEKDQRIAELENQSQNDSYTINELIKANKNFVDKIKVLEKALELACKEFKTFGFIEEMQQPDYFIKQAEKEGDKE